MESTDPSMKASVSNVKDAPKGTAQRDLAPAEIDASLVRAQLERILASTPFRNSKRYPALLRYVVEQELKGEAANLKERTIGMEVFGRDSSYDPGADPVVRVSAGEVRKRLAQNCPWVPTTPSLLCRHMRQRRLPGNRNCWFPFHWKNFLCRPAFRQSAAT
jgi:hypothetical protein